MCSVVEGWMKNLPADLADQMLAPLTPKKWGSIMKLRIQDDALKAVAFKVQKIKEQSGRATPPTWAATERSPAKVAQKRKLKLAADAIRTAFPIMAQGRLSSQGPGLPSS